MPRYDGTGPTGAGPMTGRGLGFCMGYLSPYYRSRAGRFLLRTVGYGLGLGLMWGAGRGLRRGYYRYPSRSIAGSIFNLFRR